MFVKQCKVATGFALVLLRCWCIAIHVSPNSMLCTPSIDSNYVEPASTVQTLSDMLHNVSGMNDSAIFEIINLTTPTAPHEQCGSRIHEACHGGGVWYVWCNNVLQKLKKRHTTIGLSFGISTFDFWAKYFGDTLKIPTQLYDCFATNKNTKPIPQFKVKYNRYDVCLGGTAKNDTAGRKWETLGSYLKGRPPYSVLLKLDIEGSEWNVIPNFLADSKQVNKVASIDMEFHFCDSNLNIWSQVQVFNRLLDNFVVVGRYPNDSPDRISSYPDAEKYTKNEDCGAVNGMPTMIAVSYVNKKML